MIDVLTAGEVLAALRADGLLRLGGGMHLSIAGAEANVAIGLARLGHAARWTGVVGDDELGALALRTLRAEGVDVTTCRTHPSAQTGLVLFEQRLADVTRVSYYRTASAGSHLGPDDVTAAFTDPPRLVHLTGITPALGVAPAAAVHRAARLARQHGAIVVLDVNYRARLWSRTAAASALRALVPLVDVLVASEDELDLVTPDHATSEQARVASLLDAGVTEVVVKRGARGASAWTATSQLSVPACAVNVVDSVGAGDAFVAGYLSGWLDGLDLHGRLTRGNTTGAFAVASRGDWEGLPTRAELALLGHRSGTAIR